MSAGIGGSITEISSGIGEEVSEEPRQVFTGEKIQLNLLSRENTASAHYSVNQVRTFFVSLSSIPLLGSNPGGSGTQGMGIRNQTTIAS